MNRLELQEGSRRAMLFEMLNERYFQFAENLPTGLAELATRQSTYLGSSSEERFEGVIELNPVLAGTPWLFWETFCGLDNEKFLQIAEAGTMYVLASILLDHLVDGQAKPVEEIALLHQAIYGHGIASYRSNRALVHLLKLMRKRLVETFMQGRCVKSCS